MLDTFFFKIFLIHTKHLNKTERSRASYRQPRSSLFYFVSAVSGSSRRSRPRSSIDQDLDQDGGGNRSVRIAGGRENQHPFLDTGREGGLEVDAGRERCLALTDRSRSARLSNFMIKVIQNDELA